MNSFASHPPYGGNDEKLGHSSYSYQFRASLDLVINKIRVRLRKGFTNIHIQKDVEKNLKIIFVTTSKKQKGSNMMNPNPVSIW